MYIRNVTNTFRLASLRGNSLWTFIWRTWRHSSQFHGNTEFTNKAIYIMVLSIVRVGWNKLMFCEINYFNGENTVCLDPLCFKLLSLYPLIFIVTIQFRSIQMGWEIFSTYFYTPINFPSDWLYTYLLYHDHPTNPKHSHTNRLANINRSTSRPKKDPINL